MRPDRLPKLALLALCLVLLWAPAQSQPGRSLLRRDTRWLDSPGRDQFPDAEAVIVYDDIRFEVHSDGSTAYHEHDAIKILNADGVQNHGSLVRVYRQGEAEIQVDFARTILPDGRVVDVTAEHIVDAPFIPRSRAYGSYRRFEIQFPQVVPDAVVEFHLVTRRKPGYRKAWWATSYVQNPEPILVSIFSVQAPRDLTVNWSAPGLLPSRPVRMQAGDTQELRWEIRGQSALRNEPAMPDTEDLLGRIDVSSFSNWDQLGEWYRSAWTARVQPDPRLGLITAGILPTGSTQDGKARAIGAWLAANKKQVDLSYEQMLPLSPSDLLDERVLSYWDTVSLAAAMFEFAGIRCEPVAGFSMPAEELSRQLPRPTAVSRVLLYLPDLKRWFDPAHPGDLLASPPGGFQGRAALFLGPSGPYHLADLPTADHDANREDTRVEARVDAEGAAELAIAKEQFGESALFLREAARSLAASDQTRREQILRSLFLALAQSFSPLAQVHDRYFPDGDPAGPSFPLAVTLIVPDFAAAGEGDLRQIPVPIQFDQRI
ncbi:MAG: DUF3857 domain-containing protein, partial [Candidatus Eremiobacterota bacterium]